MTHAIPTEEHPVVDLTEDECWEKLEQNQLGRLGYRLVDEVHVVPVNYTVERDGSQRALVIFTAAGNKLLAAELHSEVALEIDWFGEDAAWSVLVRGSLRRLGEAEEDQIEPLLRTWVPTLKYEAVELEARVVTGREFLLRK